MNDRNRFSLSTLCAIAALVFATALPAAAQTRPAESKQPAVAPAPTDQDVAATQEQFLNLLRLSPVLTTVVAHDPSLLADLAYVERNNPELAQFMTSHPDIAKNPEFYLFSQLENGHGHREQSLERAVWPDLVPPDRAPSQASAVMHDMVPIILFPVFFLAIVWIIRIIVESRRWNRAFKQQSEVHGRLIDKFTSSQELAAYMQTEAGKRFLEVSPSAMGTDAGVRMPNAVARVLTPLSTGIVLALTGIGLMLLRNVGPDMQEPMLVLGTLALMPGIGFILSAGATWILAHRLGLMPENADANQAAASAGPGSQFRP